jgi:hypothetical protein
MLFYGAKGTRTPNNRLQRTGPLRGPRAEQRLNCWPRQQTFTVHRSAVGGARAETYRRMAVSARAKIDDLVPR